MAQWLACTAFAFDGPGSNPAADIFLNFKFLISDVMDFFRQKQDRLLLVKYGTRYMQEIAIITGIKRNMNIQQL